MWITKSIKIPKNGMKKGRLQYNKIVQKMKQFFVFERQFFCIKINLYNCKVIVLSQIFKLKCFVIEL